MALRTAAGGVTGIEETAVRALAKLEQVLPQRLRHQVTAIQATTTPLPVPWSTGPEADPSVLATLAAACRDHEITTFTYRTGKGLMGQRRTEPWALVAAAPVWYLVAYDTYHDEWRLFRVDRLTDPTPTGHRAAPRELPATVPADAATVRALTHSLPDRVRPLDETTSTLDLAADNPDHIAEQLLGIDLGPTHTIHGTPELASHLEKLAHRLLRAAHALTTTDDQHKDPARDGLRFDTERPDGQ